MSNTDDLQNHDVAVSCGACGSSTGEASLQDATAALSFWAGVVAQAGLKETAELLAIARLDLMARVHCISEHELDMLVEVAAQQPVPSPQRPPRAGRSRRQQARRTVARA